MRRLAPWSGPRGARAARAAARVGVGLLAAWAVISCASDPGAGADGGATCFDYASFDGSSPKVAFRKDVLPIFRGSCAVSSSCHNLAVGAPADRPYLGPALAAPEPTDEELRAIFEKNVGAKSTKAKGMNIVEPGKPSQSFLMHKVDDTLKCADITGCSGATCGVRMPYGQPVMSQERRDTLRRWIAQGAKND